MKPCKMRKKYSSRCDELLSHESAKAVPLEAAVELSVEVELTAVVVSWRGQAYLASSCDSLREVIMTVRAMDEPIATISWQDTQKYRSTQTPHQYIMHTTTTTIPKARGSRKQTIMAQGWVSRVALKYAAIATQVITSPCKTADTICSATSSEGWGDKWHAKNGVRRKSHANAAVITATYIKRGVGRG
jgi:hypothetical protein